jgi:hypothetical protein
MLEFVVYFTSISNAKNEKRFRNVNDVLAYVDRYKIDRVDVNGEDFAETYTDMNEFEEAYQNVTS